MRACDFLQWHALRNLKTTPSRSQGGIQVPRGGNLRLGRRMRADLGNQTRARTHDHRRACTPRRCLVRSGAHGSDDQGPGTLRELHRTETPGAGAALHQHRARRHRPRHVDRPMRGDAGNPQAGALLHRHVVGDQLEVPVVIAGVLVAVAGAIVYSRLAGYEGDTVGEIRVEPPPFSLDLGWDAFPSLVVPGIVIAVVGFAEPAAIARTFAAAERRPWDPDRELVSQGAANVAAAVSGGFPVGGSFSRSALNRLAGARTRWSGAVTGLAVLAFLPLASSVSPPPPAVLAAIVIGAVVGLVLGAIGEVGDLAESLLKRQTGVKDAGRAIPGHGGVLDRIDSLLFTAPAVYYISLLV